MSWRYGFAENMAMCFAKWAPHRHSVRRRSRSAQNASVHRPRDGCLGADELQGPVQRLTLRGGREHRGTVAAARQFFSRLAFSVPGPEPRLYPAACDRCGVQQAEARTSQPAGLKGAHMYVMAVGIASDTQAASFLKSTSLQECRSFC